MCLFSISAFLKDTKGVISIAKGKYFLKDTLYIISSETLRVLQLNLNALRCWEVFPQISTIINTTWKDLFQHDEV